MEDISLCDCTPLTEKWKIELHMICALVYLKMVASKKIDINFADKILRTLELHRDMYVDEWKLV